MRNWLLAFRPETYDKVKVHQTIGVLKKQRVRFSVLAPQDRFVVYLTQVQLLDGHGVITGEPFEGTDPIFGESFEYPCRCKVRLTETGLQGPVKDSLWFLDAFRDQKTHPTNVLFCRGGFTELTGSDYEYLLRLLSGVEFAEKM